MRPRDSLLEAILALKALDARISVNEIVTFLYVCENEGLCVQELAHVADLTQSTASRSLRSLGRPESDWAQPPALGLVDAFLNPADSRSHVVHLSERGRAVRHRLDDMIRRAVTIEGDG
ncbi:MAG TPA: MarR family winged helix-turn-helix transcriptional regulator [Phenylobacterium sp.]|nr:MarR family winged helix-turn-helix transcriptional regulator [Phenylobacterium sp.]